MPVALALVALALAILAALPAPASAREPTAAVALGDSFIAGQGGRWQGNSVDLLGSRGGTDRACRAILLGCRYDIGSVYLGGSAPPGCARSDVAEILSAEIAVSERINLACSGATTSAIIRGAHGGRAFKGEPPQADQLAGIARERTVKLVVLSIGANDIGFGEIVRTCVFAYLDRTGPCRNGQRSAIDARLTAALAGVEQALLEIRAVMRAAGYRPWHYRLVLQSYPSPIPRAAENRYPEAGLQRSAAGGCPFYDTDSDFAREEIVGLLDSRLEAISTATGAQFLSLRDAFQGREVCARTARQARGSGGPSPRTSEWVRAVGAGPAIQGGTTAESAHPNAYGQRALGRCLTLLYARRTSSWSCRNTPGEGPEGMFLTRVSTIPSRFTMSLKVRPRRTVARRRTCFRFRLRSAGRPVERATVRLAGRRVRTDGRGRAGKCLRLRARRHRVGARRAGFRAVSTIVTVRRRRR
ncbi:MAG: GDSL-type esterase/lipase family protein [Thermoleophilaceae bacterium]